MTSEAIDMRGEGALSLAKRIPWRGPWVLHPSTLQAVFSFAVGRIIVRRSLGCEDARDNATRGASWSGAQHMRNKTRPDCCVGEISFHLIFLFFCPQLLSSQFDALLSDGGEAKVLVSKGVNIGNDSSISQVQEGVVNYGAVRGRGVEDGKVSVARGRTIEICVRERASMERSSVGGEIGRAHV